MNEDHVLAAWVQGDEDPADLRDLQRWLQEDPHHRRWARDELALHLALRAQLQPADAAAVARLVDEVGIGRSGARTTQRHRMTRSCLDAVDQRRRQRWIRGLLALAAALLLGVGAATISYQSSQPKQQSQPTPVISHQENAIGRITTLSGVAEVERAGQRRVLVAGEALHAGDRVIAGTGSVIAWQDDAAELELREGDCLVQPRPDITLAVHAGLMRVATLPTTSKKSSLRLIAATAEIETSDAIMRVAINEGGTHLDVERGQAVIAQGGTRHVVTPESPTYYDASGTYRILFHFDQAGPERNPRVPYGDPLADPTAPDGWSLRGVLLDDAREVYLEDATLGLMTLEAGAQLRITYRITGHGPLRVFAHNQDLQADITAELGMVTESGWHTVIIQLSDFHRQGPLFDQPGAFPGNRLRNLIIASDQPQSMTELQVDEVLCVAPASP